jgi:putative transposase
MNAREIRAYAIIAKGESPESVDSENWLVASQSGNGKYRVTRTGTEWSCECPDFSKRRLPCKHIITVMFFQKVKSKRRDSFTIPEIQGKVCPFCGSTETIKRGMRKTTGEPKQRFSCRKCGRRFVSDVCSRSKGTEKTITAVMDMYYKGLSVRQIQQHLREFHGFSIHYSTVYRWVTKFSKRMADYTEGIKTGPCNTIAADETMIRAGGEWAYMWNVMDKRSRFLTASYVSKHRDGVYARTVFEESKAKAGKPVEVVTDGYWGYCGAKRKVFGWKTIHTRDIHFMNREKNNNRMERCIGSIKGRTKVMRGMQNAETGNELMRGWMSYYNFIRPHMALGGMTPAEAKGIAPKSGWLQILKKSEG